MQLQEHVDDPLHPGRLLVYLTEQAEAVNGMYERHVGGDVLYLVGLQVADEMPLDVLREYAYLLLQFLYVAFAKDALSGIVCLTYHGSGVVLADGHEARSLWHLCLELMYRGSY